MDIIYLFPNLYLNPISIILSLLFIGFIVWDKKRKNFSTKEFALWIIAAAILGLILIPIYFYINRKPTEPNTTPQTFPQNSFLKKLKWLFFIILFAPAPFYMCFDGCLSPQFILPPIIAWTPLLTLISFFAPIRLFWHGIFLIPFLITYVPNAIKIEKNTGWSPKKRRWIKLITYLTYWAIITIFWTMIPFETRLLWLNQQP